jgi:hypothetical protein
MARPLQTGGLSDLEVSSAPLRRAWSIPPEEPMSSNGPHRRECIEPLVDHRFALAAAALTVSRSSFWRGCDAGCGIFATLGKFFDPVKLQRGFSAPLSPAYNMTGGVGMSIESLLLILVLTMGVAFVLNRLDVGRHL